MEWDDFKKNILCNRKLGIINIIIGLALIALGEVLERLPI